MHSSLVILAALAAAVPVYAQGALWAQCGGIGFSGSTTCVSGACCKVSNEYYSQCVPSDQCGGAVTTTARTTTRAGTTAATTRTTTASGSSSTGCGGGSPNAVVSGSGSSFTASRGGTNLYSGSDYLAAINAALNGISTGQRVSVLASGSIGAGTISIGAGKTFEVCGTLNASLRSGRGAIEVINTNDVSIPYLTMTGSPYFGLRFSGTRNLNLGKITMNLSGGIAIRFDRDANWNYGVKIGDVTCSGVPGHCVETFKIDGLTINSVTATNVGECGLLIQESMNVNVGSVRGNNVAAGGGYATLRFANRNGRRGDSYAANVFVNSVYSRGGGRGIFCVSESGGAVINSIDLASNGNNSILIENCYGVEIKGGTVNGGGEVRLAARSEFANNRDIKITLRVDGTTVRESPCGTNISWNLSGNGSRNIC